MALLTPQQTVRFFILGLPIGLVITGIAAMFIYFKVDTVREREESRVILSKALNETDLRAQVQVLAGGIGARHAGAPETLASAQKYVQSTLGPANLGFKVSRHEYEVAGETFYNLEIDLPGAPGPRAEEIVLVTANYDTVAGSPGADSNASGVSAMMSLAQSFGGAASARSLRFVALVNEVPPWAGTERSGSAAYAASLRTRQDKVVAVVSLEGLGIYLDGAESQRNPAGPALVFPPVGNFLAMIANARGAEFLSGASADFATATKLPLVAVSGVGQPALLGESMGKGFDAAGLAVLRVTDTGALRAVDFQLAGDRVDKLDFGRLLEATRGIEAVLRTLLNPAPSRR